VTGAGRRPGVRAATLGLAALLPVLGGCGGASPSAPPEPSPGPGADPSSPSGFAYRGVTHVSWWHDEYQYAAGAESRERLAASGANWAGVLVTWYMETRESNAIGPAALRSPTDEAVRDAIRELRALGLQVMLKPHVDVLDGAWRGTIRPRDPALWFASYAAFLDRMAGLAREEGVGLLCVGTELATLSGARHGEDWARVIAGVRARYGGPLTYAANGVGAADEYTSVAFWDRLDLLGLDVYTPLTDRRDPSRAELAAGWRRNRNGEDMLAAFRNWQSAHGKPVVFTEIGYRSADGANRAPWDWEASMVPDPGEQADCYQAAFEVWSREAGWMRGAFWWAWDVSAPGPADSGYNPRGKPAEAVLRAWQ